MVQYYSGHIGDNHKNAIDEATADIKTELFIDGEWRKPVEGNYLETKDPAVNKTITEVPAGTEADIDDAVAAADRAFKGWKQTLPPERQKVLNQLARRMEQKVDKFALLESLDTGKPLNIAKAEVERAIKFIRYYAGITRSLEGKQLPFDTDSIIFSRREPYGVVGQIIPWNFPIVMAVYKIGPALATGNTVVLKPAEQTPLTALQIAREAQEVVPDGVLNVVTGFGAEAGEALTSHPRVKKLAFTGETTTGRRIMQNASENVVPVTLELGGKSPFIVFPDADIDKAVDAVSLGVYYNTGQSCDACSRAFVHEDIRDEFLDALVEATESEVVGDPLQEDTTLGPLASEQQFEKVTNYIGVGRDEGAEVVTGGGAPEGEEFEHGWFIEPTVFAGANNSMRIAQEEIFGPVESIITWSDYDEMIEEANDVDYGLAAGMATEDISLAHQTAERLEAGNIWVNKYGNLPPGVPFGGFKQSGIGREHTTETLLHYTQIKSVDIATDDSPM